MSNHSPGWYPDPMRHYAQRYYDGTAWTEHVADATSNRGTDPIPSAPSTPAASGAPGSTFAPPTAAASTPTTAAPYPGAASSTTTAPSAPSAATTTGTSATGLSVTVGLIVVGVGALLALLGLFALDYWTADGVGVNLGDISDAPSGADINGLVSAYAGFGRFLGLLVIALAIVAVLRLPALAQFEDKLPLVAAGVAGLWGLWHLVGMFMSPEQFDAGPAFGAFLGVLGFAGMAVGQFLRQPVGNVNR